MSTPPLDSASLYAEINAIGNAIERSVAICKDLKKDYKKIESQVQQLAFEVNLDHQSSIQQLDYCIESLNSMISKLNRYEKDARIDSMTNKIEDLKKTAFDYLKQHRNAFLN